MILFKSPLLIWIEKMFKHAEKNQWYETYWAFDVHGVISKPDYRRNKKEILYYPYAKETLQLLSERDDIIMFLFTSSYPEEIQKYLKTFISDDINFNYVNENPEISSEKGSFGYYYDKPYYNVFLEDKAGFDPNKDWKRLYNYFKKPRYKPDKNWSIKIIKPTNGSLTEKMDKDSSDFKKSQSIIKEKYNK